MKYVVLLVMSTFLFQLKAQKEIKYVSPPKLIKENFNIKIDNVVSEEEFCKFKLQIENKSDKYMSIDLSKVGFNYDGNGTYFPPKGKLKVIAPKSTTNSVVKLAGNGLNYLAPKFEVRISGLGNGIEKSKISVDNFELIDGAQVAMDDVSLDIAKLKIKNGKVSFSVNVNYSNNGSQFAAIDLSKIEVYAGENRIEGLSNNAKKTKILQNGKGTSCNISFESDATEFTIKHSILGATYEIQDQNVDAITVLKPGYSPTPVSNSAKPNSTGNCDQFSANNIDSKPVKLTIYSEEGTCFQVQAFGVNVNPNFSSNVEMGFDISGKVNLLMQDGSKLEKKIVLNNDIIAASYKLKKNKKGEFVLKLVAGSVQYKENTVTNSSGNSETKKKGITIKTSSSSTKTVNGRVIESNSSSNEINIGD